MAKKPEPFKGPYEHMEFPGYVFREYPKMVELKGPLGPGGKPQTMIVHNHAEELRAMDQIVPVSQFDAVSAERQSLVEQLEAANARLREAESALAKLAIPEPQAAPAELVPAKVQTSDVLVTKPIVSPTIKVPVSK